MQIEDRRAILRLIFYVGQQQVVAHGHPDLRHHRVRRRPQERLYLQVLLDPLEENLYLPPGLIDVRDGGRGQFEIIGQEFKPAGYRLLQHL